MTTILFGAAANIAGGAANQIPVQIGTDQTGFAAAPTVPNTYLSWNGTNFVWGTPSGGATIPAGVANQIPYQINSSQSGFTAAPTVPNTYLSWNGTNFVWSNPNITQALSNSSNSNRATVASNLGGGNAGSIPYQTGANQTSLLPIGSDGYVLTSVGGVPTWAKSSSSSSAQVGTSNLVPPSGVATDLFTIPANSQYIVSRRLIVAGHLINKGRVVLL